MTTQYDKIVADTASKYNIPPTILHNLIQQESGFNPNAVSSAGAQGIAQFMPATAKGYGINPFDPNQAIPAAGQYLQKSFKQFGNWPSALAAYNAGAGAVQKYGGVPPYPETQNYVKSILGNIDGGQPPQTSQQPSIMDQIIPKAYAEGNMSKYEITSPTGEKKVVSLDHEPTPQDMQTAFQAPDQSKAGWLNPALQIGGAVGGGMLGGGLGAALGLETGPGAIATGYLGGVAGAGAGAGVGNAGADWIRKNLLKDPTVDMSKTVNNSVGAAEAGAAGQAIGVPVAKGLGFLAHPIAPFIGRVNNILAKSAKEINVGEVGGLLQHFRDNILPQFAAQGKGMESKAAYNRLSARVVDMVNSLQKHIPAQANSAAEAAAGISTGQVNPSVLPVAAANTIKRNLYGLVKDMGGLFGEMGNTESQVTKAFASTVKNAIAGAEPGVKLPNAIASALYKVPDALKALSNIPSFGQPLAARTIQQIGNLPFGLIQKVIPQGGGYLKQVLPRLFQAGFGINSQ